jgi:GT2 family glycosyltransferase
MIQPENPSNLSTAPPPFISIVIPCYERPNDLRRCLQSLCQENQRDSPPYEIIVSDDSRTDNCKKVVEQEFPLAKWDSGKHNGPGGNRNAGVSRAAGEWIVFIDDDCIAQKGYLPAYFRAIQENPGVDLFEGYISPDRPKKTWAETCPENSTGGMFWTSNLCVRKEVFDEFDGFDETFKVAYEDVDFAYRLQKEEKKTLFVKDAVACHPWRTLRNKGNNWKPKGFEWEELKLFLNKHPNANEHNAPTIYARHLLRMTTKDLCNCIIKFRCRGLAVLLGQIHVTFSIMIRLINKKFFA